MINLGLIGYPLSHSLSGVIHAAALKSLNMDGCYNLLETPPEELVQRVKFLKANDYKGFNITIPLKVPITMFLDRVDEAANLAGAVNTVKIMEDKSLVGFNTDIYGFKQAIHYEDKEQLSGNKGAILGTGGASRACAIGLIELGVKEIDFYSRNIINSADTINFLRAQFPNVAINLKQYQSIERLDDVAILVNTTPVGMINVAMSDSLVTDKHLKTMKEGSIVYDIVYNPFETVLLKTAKNCGLKTINGLDMLVYQAQRAFEIWTEVLPSFKTMKIAALENLLTNK